ncbi:MAG: ankyrin repeat domain-containing protein [Thermoanaerobaculaceae bacterium]
MQAGDLAKVKALLERDPAQVNAKDDGGRTPLHLAARGTSTEVLALLVERGADVHALDGNGIAPLHSLASRGDADGIRLLLDRGADVNVSSPNRRTPLHFAVLGRQDAVLGLLAERKANLESPDDRGRTPLVVAAREMAGPEVVRTLLDLGARIDAADRYGDTSLSLAAWRGSAEVVSLLLARGAALPPAGPKAQQLLGLAVSKGLPELFARLVEKGADLSAPTEAGGSLLAAAAEGGSVPILQALIARRLDVDHRDDNGWTPLHFATDLGHRAAIELLLAKGASIDARTAMGQSPLNIAEDNGDSETIALLRARGASPAPPAFPVLEGPYLGQKPPGRTAEVFAPGIASGRYGLHSSVIFSPDGKEALWALMLPGKANQYGTGRTVVSRLVDGRWSYPREAVCEGTKVEDVPAFHPDGTVLFDMAERPFPGRKEPGKENIWVWEKGPAGWRNPRPVDAAVNDLPHHWQFGVDRRGDLYFSTNVPGSLGGGDIWVSRRVDGRYQPPVNLGPSVNTPAGEDFPYISPDGQTLLFGRSFDIYVSTRAQDGTWTRARRLGPEVNTPGMEVLPSLSPDGKVLFFSRGFRTFWVDAGVVRDRAGKGSVAEEVEQALAGGGVERARTRFAAVRGAGAAAYFVDEAELNALGYRLLQAGKTAEAIAVLEMNTEAFPGSWNVWDSLGEACLQAGDRERAVAHYSRSVELNPANQNAKDALARLRSAPTPGGSAASSLPAPAPGEAVVWYLGHCGYAVRTSGHLLVFDYIELEESPTERGLAKGFVDPAEIKDLKVRVLVSHSHVDHFDRTILDWQKTVPDIEYVFGWQALEGARYHNLPGPRATLEAAGDEGPHGELPPRGGGRGGVPRRGGWAGPVPRRRLPGADGAGPSLERGSGDMRYLRAGARRPDLMFLGAWTGDPYLDIIRGLEPRYIFPGHYRKQERKYREFAEEIRRLGITTPVILPGRRGRQLHLPQRGRSRTPHRRRHAERGVGARGAREAPAGYTGQSREWTPFRHPNPGRRYRCFARSVWPFLCCSSWYPRRLGSESPTSSPGRL